MGDLGLFFVGAVLFINGLMLLNKVERISAAVFNLFIGVLQVFTPLYLIISSKADPLVLLDAAGIFLFGFTYLYVGLSTIFNLETNGAGWYCLWVAIMGGGFSALHLLMLDDPKMGLLWSMWAFLWFLFYLLLAKKMPIEKYVGKVTIYQSWITVVTPAILSLIGVWSMVETLVVLVITLFSYVYFAVAYYVSHTKSEKIEEAAR